MNDYSEFFQILPEWLEKYKNLFESETKAREEMLEIYNDADQDIQKAEEVLDELNGSHIDVDDIFTANDILIELDAAADYYIETDDPSKLEELQEKYPGAFSVDFMCYRYLNEEKYFPKLIPGLLEIIQKEFKRINKKRVPLVEEAYFHATVIEMCTTLIDLDLYHVADGLVEILNTVKYVDEYLFLKLLIVSYYKIEEGFYNLKEYYPGNSYKMDLLFDLLEAYVLINNFKFEEAWEIFYKNVKKYPLIEDYFLPVFEEYGEYGENDTEIDYEYFIDPSINDDSDEMVKQVMQIVFPYYDDDIAGDYIRRMLPEHSKTFAEKSEEVIKDILLKVLSSSSGVESVYDDEEDFEYDFYDEYQYIDSASDVLSFSKGELLLEAFPTYEDLRNATADDILAIPGIGKVTLEKLIDFYDLDI